MEGSVADNRAGRWVVPERLTVCSRAGTVKLDFTDALIEHPVVEINLDVAGGTMILVLPSEAAVDIDGVDLGGTSLRCTASTEPGDGKRFVLTGRQRRGVLKIRYQRRFARWRW
jgi:hypothetical protein